MYILFKKINTSKRIMFVVTGANLFNQWFLSDEILDKFTTIPQKPDKKLDLERAKIVCITWSYIVLQIDDEFIVSGAWCGKDGQITTLPLPEECSKSIILISCNDYNIVIVDVCNNALWVLDLKTEIFKRVHIVERHNLENILDIEQSNMDIVKVQATNNTCVLLTKSGIVFTGALPSYIDTKHCLGKVCDVQCGYEHFLLLTDKGRVYSWGNGRRLQLGHGDINNIEIPTELEALAGIKIVKISASGWHSLALSESGDLYSWGWNDTGQLGIQIDDHSKECNNFGVPNLINISDENSKEVELNIIDIACGTRHSAILLENNSVWTTGCNKYGQLGFPLDQYSKIENFKKCYNAFQGATLLCGPWCTVVVY